MFQHLFNQGLIIDHIVGIPEPSNTLITDGFDSFVNCQHRFIFFDLPKHILDDGLVIGPLYWMLEWALHPYVAWLMESCATSRYVVQYNIVVVLWHPSAELFRSMHGPNIDLPECFLGWRKTKEGSFAHKVRRKDVVNKTMHGCHVWPVRPHSWMFKKHPCIHDFTIVGSSFGWARRCWKSCVNRLEWEKSSIIRNGNHDGKCALLISTNKRHLLCTYRA